MILNDKILDTFSLKSGRSKRCLLSPLLFIVILENLANTIWRRMRGRGGGEEKRKIIRKY